MISLIVPFYNEAQELSDLVKDLDVYESNHSSLIEEYIFINDCSNDNSVEVLKEAIKNCKKLKKKKIIIFSNDKNIGWCKSLIKGYFLATQKYSLFIPGDGEAKITEFLINVNLTDDKEVMVFQRSSMSGRPKFRIFISYLYKVIISSIFCIKRFDLNGLILIRSDYIKKIKLQSNSYFISAEIILTCEKLGYKIDHNNFFVLFPKKKYKSSSLTFAQFKNVLNDFLKFLIFFYLDNKKKYL